jgi:Family of unknown function (DUF6152)
MRTLISAMIAVVATTPLVAHHRADLGYDTKHRVTLKGTVTEVEWRNPHVILHLDAKNGNGTVAMWDVQTLGPVLLMQQGLNLDFIKAGDTVNMTVCVAKDGAMKAVTRAIELPGRTAYIRVGGC